MYHEASWAVKRDVSAGGRHMRQEKTDEVDTVLDLIAVVVDGRKDAESDDLQRIRSVMSCWEMETGADLAMRARDEVAPRAGIEPRQQ